MIEREAITEDKIKENFPKRDGKKGIRAEWNGFTNEFQVKITKKDSSRNIFTGF